MAGLTTWFKKISKILAPHAVTILALSGLVSFIIYFKMITLRAPLSQLYDRKLLDLGTLFHRNPVPALEIMAGFLILGVLYAAAYWSVQQIQNRDAWLLVFGWMVLFTIPLLLVYPYGAADIFDNIVHGRILSIYHANPFSLAAVNFKNDPFVAYSFWKNAPSAYGPLWEAVAGAAAWLAGDGIVTNIIVFKLLPGLFLFASAALVALLLRKSSPAKALAGVVLLAWNPLVLYETLGNGHNDIVMAFWFLAAALALQNKRFTIAIALLTLGGLVKYIPFLLIPIAGMIALASLPDRKAQIKFLLITSATILGLLAAGFLPFWIGPETLTLARRAHLFTSSIPTIIYLKLIPQLGEPAAGTYVSAAAALITLGFTLWQAFQARRNPNWISFLQASFYVIIFYLLVACPFFQVWYAIWPIVIAAPLLSGAEIGLAVLFSFTALLKAFFVRPLWFWNNPNPDRLVRETTVMLGSLGLAWLFSTILIIKSARRKHE